MVGLWVPNSRCSYVRDHQQLSFITDGWAINRLKSVWLHRLYMETGKYSKFCSTHKICSYTGSFEVKVFSVFLGLI